MSRKHDKLAAVKLTEENRKELDNLRVNGEVPASLCAMANVAIEAGIKVIKQRRAIAAAISKPPHTKEQLRDGWAGQRKKESK